MERKLIWKKYAKYIVMAVPTDDASLLNVATSTDTSVTTKFWFRISIRVVIIFVYFCIQV